MPERAEKKPQNNFTSPGLVSVRLFFVMSFRISTIVSVAILLLSGLARSQEQKPGQTQNMQDMNMPGHQMPEMPGTESEGTAHAMHSMEGRHMDMGPHMKMTALRAPQPGDAKRAQQVVEAARNVAEKYKDYKVALADGFKIFMPNVPQKQYHFTNYWYGFEAAMYFDPERPTSLLYEKQGDGYKLIGVMYTAEKDASENELNERIPLSIAQWHAHVNLCLPPPDRRKELRSAHPQFGLAGSISTQAACDAAGGKFLPQIFGWMVHVYPFEQRAENIWSVKRQAHGHMD
jgi:hypothetical protein